MIPDNINIKPPIFGDHIQRTKNGRPVMNYDQLSLNNLSSKTDKNPFFTPNKIINILSKDLDHLLFFIQFEGAAAQGQVRAYMNKFQQYKSELNFTPDANRTINTYTSIYIDFVISSLSKTIQEMSKTTHCSVKELSQNLNKILLETNNQIKQFKDNNKNNMSLEQILQSTEQLLKTLIENFIKQNSDSSIFNSSELKIMKKFDTILYKIMPCTTKVY